MRRSLVLLLFVSCRQAPETVRVHLDAGPDAAVVGDPCVDASSADPDMTRLRFVRSLMRVGFEPRGVDLFGARMYVPLFPLRASEEPPDVLECKSGSRSPAEMWVECTDGPQAKRAEVRLRSEEVDITVTIDGQETRATHRVPACVRLVADLTVQRDVTAPRPNACPVTGKARDVEVRVQTFGPRVELVVPSLGLRRLLAEVAFPGECRTEAVPERSWMAITCPGEGSGLMAKIVASGSELAVVKGPLDRDYIPLPCGTHAVLIGLPSARAPAPPSSR
jgi:hypothetical protein